jgi:hypothetical protein
LGEKSNTSGVQRDALELLEQISAEELRRYREKISESSAPLRKLQPYMFGGFEDQNLQETSDATLKADVIRQMQDKGYSSQDAESKVSVLKYSSKDMVISLQTRIKSFGFEASQVAVTIRIWP